MSDYLSRSDHLARVFAEGRAAELAARAERARLLREVRSRRPRRVRASTARLLVAMASRLDDRLQPVAVAAVDVRAGC
jgi:hypothetical protein